MFVNPPPTPAPENKEQNGVRVHLQARKPASLLDRFNVHTE